MSSFSVKILIDLSDNNAKMKYNNFTNDNNFFK